MKTLIIGASGGFGGAVARELVQREMETTALVREGGRKPDIDGLWLANGDALDEQAVRRAAEGMDVIVFGFNVPYPRWAKEAIRATEIVANVAAEIGATVLFPGNVYGLGRDFEKPLAEDCPREAPTELGRIRNRMEAILAEAAERGASVIIVRAGDYFGQGAANTWFEQLTRKALGGGALLDPAPSDVPHCWAYLPDVARAAVELALRRHELESFAEYHFAGYSITSAELFDTVRRALGDHERKIRSLPWWALRLVSPLWATGRALLSMRYLWNEPVLLDDAKLRAFLGEGLVTTLDSAIATSLVTARGDVSHDMMDQCVPRESL